MGSLFGPFLGFLQEGVWHAGVYIGARSFGNLHVQDPGYPLNEKDCLNRVTLGTFLLVLLPLLLLLSMARFFIGVYRALWERLYKRTTVLPETLDSIWLPVNLEEGLP